GKAAKSELLLHTGRQGTAISTMPISIQRTTKMTRKVRCIQVGSPSVVGRTDCDSPAPPRGEGRVETFTGSEPESACPLPFTAEAEFGADVRTSFSEPILMIVSYGEEAIEVKAASQELSFGNALRPESLNSFSYIAIINIRPVDLHQIVQSCLAVSGCLVGRGQIVIDSQPAFFCYSGNFEGTLVPAHCCLWSSF